MLRTVQTSYFCGYACAKNLHRGPRYRSRPCFNYFVQVGRHLPFVHRRCADGRFRRTSMSFVSVASFDDLNHLDPVQGGILVLKHSPRCSISLTVHHRVQLWLETRPTVRIGLVNVLTDRDFSQGLAREWGVEHESPQILFRAADGRVHHASHFGITENWLDALN